MSLLKTIISSIKMFSRGVGIDTIISPILILGAILPLIITKNLIPSRKDTKTPMANTKINIYAIFESKLLCFFTTVTLIGFVKLCRINDTNSICNTTGNIKLRSELARGSSGAR